MRRKTSNSVAGEKKAAKTAVNVAGNVVVSVRNESTSKSATGKTYEVTFAGAKGRGQTVVTLVPGKVLKASTTLKPGKIVNLSRSKVVGKYPEIHHLPAPKTKLKLDKETRNSLLDSMVLI